MKQSRLQSAIETATSTAIGFVIAFAATALVLPAFGYRVSHSDNFWITCIFTAISLARGWCVRRLFDWWHHRETPDMALARRIADDIGTLPISIVSRDGDKTIKAARQEIMESSDVIRQWTNPCVREAHLDWQQRFVK